MSQKYESIKISDDTKIKERNAVFIGKNGSGKSFLLAHINNNYKSDSSFIPSARSVYQMRSSIDQIKSLEEQNNSAIVQRGQVHYFDMVSISKLISKDYEYLSEKRTH